jgi:DNA-binding CsgD family transcriptional regulator
MTASDLDRGRDSFASRAWGAAFEQLSATDRQAPLAAEDLELAARAAFLVGKDADSTDLWTRAHQAYLNAASLEEAVRCAFWAGFQLMLRGEMAPAGGWFERARRLIEEEHLDCVEAGYLLLPPAVQALFTGDASTALATFGKVAEIADRFGDQDLRVMSRFGSGQALIASGEVAPGLASLDEAMVAVTADEVSPWVIGLVYCGVIDSCQQLFDLRRAQEWTAALSRWCESQPDLVPYRGQCLVHRAQIMQIHGAWSDAMQEAERACDRLAQPLQPAVGMAYYQVGELRRLRGEFAEAENAYRQASQYGRSPQPGLAQLRLAQGRLDGALTAIRLAVDEADDYPGRAQLLPACVEISLAGNDVPMARSAADELSRIATRMDVPLLRAVATHAHGAVLYAEGDARRALNELKKAWNAWCDIDAPYEAARARVLMALAYRALGDYDTAEMELDAALLVLRELGAKPEVERVEKLSPRKRAGGLTAREEEVLALVAAGKTNRAIAGELVISEKTVARHLSNIFTKLGVSSRSAATAYAYEHDLV